MNLAISQGTKFEKEKIQLLNLALQYSENEPWLPNQTELKHWHKQEGKSQVIILIYLLAESLSLETPFIEGT